MKNEWKEYSLEEIADIVDCEHKTAPTVDRSEYYSIRTPNISDGRIDFDNSNRISYETYLKWTQRAIPKEGDIILAREAPVGAVGLVKKGYKVCLGQRTVLISVNFKDCHSVYLLYYLVNPDVKQRLISRTTGSVVSHLNVKDIRSFAVHLPPLPEQKRIAEILSSLDDKIELNNKMYKNLEEMAQAIYKQWFVDFEFPDEAGNPYKSSGGKMIQSELGDIPAGWSVKELGDICEKISKGSTPTQSEVANATDESKVFFIKVKDISDNGEVSFDLEYIPNSIHASTLKRSILNRNDILISIAGTIGRVSFVDERLDNSNTNQAIAFIRLNDKAKHFLIVYYFLRNIDTQNNLLSKVVQGVQANISLSILGGLKLPTPTDDFLNNFNEKVSGVFNKINQQRKEILVLDIIKNTILPKLMSGKIEVEIEKQ